MIYAILYRRDKANGAHNVPCSFVVIGAGNTITDMDDAHKQTRAAVNRHKLATAYRFMTGYSFTGARPISPIYKVVY